MAITYTATTSTTSDSTWGTWSNATTINYVWSEWTTVSNATLSWTTWNSAGGYTIARTSVHKPTQAERYAQRRDEIRRKRERRRILANAASLLESILSPEERLELRRHDSVTVHGSNGGAFRVVRDWEGMLWQLDRETLAPVQKLCVHPSMDFPTGDRMATLILWLRADEAAVLAQANRHTSSPEELRRVAARRTYKGWRALPQEEAA